MIDLIFATLLATSSPQPMIVRETIASQPESAANNDQPVRLNDLPVEGVRRRELIDRFVRNVAAPTPGRQLARWRYRAQVCAGVVNLEPESGQYIADRIGDVARELGLNVAGPNCQPNILVVATTNPQTTGQWLKNSRNRVMLPRESGTSPGRTALENFVESEAPVRWWHTTSVDSISPATGIPGDSNLSQKLSEFRISHTFASNILASEEDFLEKVIIIINPNELNHLTTEQVTDLITFVALAQVNPEADTSAYSSILNANSYPDEVESLTEWDWSYLKGLYSAQRTQKVSGAALDEIAASIERQARRLASNNNE